MMKMIKSTSTLAIFILLQSCAADNVRRWADSGIGLTPEDVIAVFEKSDKRNSKSNPKTEYKIIHKSDGTKEFITSAGLDSCRIHYYVDSSNILRDYVIKGDC